MDPPLPERPGPWDASARRAGQVLLGRTLRSSRLPSARRAYASCMRALVPATTRQRERALQVLLSRDLEPIVDMVSWSRADGAYEVASADGSVRFR